MEDYIGTWAGKTGNDASVVLDNLPDITLNDLKNLLKKLSQHQEKAKLKPGYIISGNPVLGLPEKEFIPSPDELIVSEIGFALKKLVESIPKEDLEQIKAKQGLATEKVITFMPILFDHSDVMGSGRFFYAERIDPLAFRI